MTLTSTDVRVQYDGDDSGTAFPVTFLFWGLDDLEVVLQDANGAETDWTRGTQYTLTGGAGSTGTLTVITTPTDYTPATGEKLTIKSALPNTQPTDIPLGGKFSTVTLEQQLDQIVRQGQQRDETLVRALLYPLSDASTLSAEIPASAQRAGKILGFDGGGEPVAIVESDQSATGVTPTDRTSSRTLAIQATLAQSVLDVTDPDFGATGNGSSDDSVPIQAAIDSVSSGSAVLIKVPPGTFKLDSNVTPNGRIVSIQVDPAATFTGSGTLKLFNTNNYGNKGQKNSYIAAVRGTDSVPISEPSPLLALTKHTDAAETTDRDPTVHIGAHKHSTGAGVRVESLFCETVDEVGGPGSFVESGRFHTLLNPEMVDVAAAIQDDGGAFTDQTTEATQGTANDMNLLPAVPASGDAYLFGASTTFSQLRLEMGTAGVGTYTITWKYWNGAWTNLSGVNDGTSDLKTTGTKHVKFTVPGDWATTTINSQGPFFYIKGEVDGGTVTTVPLGTQAWSTETGRSNGLVSFAGTDVYPEYLIGHESTIFNNSGADASTTWSVTENSTCFLATGSNQAGSSAVHSWYATWGQPSGVTNAHVGYLVAPNRTTGAAFRSLADTEVGLDLKDGTQSTASITLPNTGKITSTNAGGSAEHDMLAYNGSNQLVIGNNLGDIKWGKNTVALGAGGAATLGNTGGSGPGTTAQNSWLRFVDANSGTAAWLAVWK